MNRFVEFSRSIFRKKYLACVETENKWFMLRVRCAKRVPTQIPRCLVQSNYVRRQRHSEWIAFDFGCSLHIALALNSFCFAHIFWQHIQRTRIGHTYLRGRMHRILSCFGLFFLFRWFLVHSYKQHWPLHDCHNTIVYSAFLSGRCQQFELKRTDAHN